MISNAAGFLIFLAVFGIVACNPDGGVDCRKFVFAPLCRGVAAKRDQSSPGRYDPAILINEESYKHLLGSLRTAIELLEQDDEGSRRGTSAIKQSKIEDFGKMYQQEQNNRLLRFLFGSKRSNSERDNYPVQDFENL